MVSESQTLTPLRLEGTRAEDIAELRKNVHEAVDALFDSVEYDAHGELVNRLSVKRSTDFFNVPVMSDIDVHLSAEKKLEIVISSTFRQLDEELSRLKVKKAVDEGMVELRGTSAGHLIASFRKDLGEVPVHGAPLPIEEPERSR